MTHDIFKVAKNTPPHWFLADTIYMLMASIYKGTNLIQSSQRKAEWHKALHKAAEIYHWQILAWVVLHNHYHAIVHSPQDPSSLSDFPGSYHKFTARRWNKEDGMLGRQVWWNCWDSCIHSEDDYYNRLQYVFWNPVKHGLVDQPEECPFSSYRGFLEERPDFEFPRTDEITNVPEY